MSSTTTASGGEKDSLGSTDGAGVATVAAAVASDSLRTGCSCSVLDVGVCCLDTKCQSAESSKDGDSCGGDIVDRVEGLVPSGLMPPVGFMVGSTLSTGLLLMLPVLLLELLSLLALLPSLLLPMVSVMFF